MRIAPLLFLALASVGCGGAVMTAPRTAAPVLLGPVDRVGGHQAVPVADDATRIKTKTSAGLYVYTVGPYIVGARYDSGTTPATNAILDATEARDDRDVHVTSLKSGGNGLVLGGVSWHNEATLRATVGKVAK